MLFLKKCNISKRISVSNFTLPNKENSRINALKPKREIFREFKSDNSSVDPKRFVLDKCLEGRGPSLITVHQKLCFIKVSKHAVYYHSEKEEEEHHTEEEEEEEVTHGSEELAEGQIPPPWEVEKMSKEERKKFEQGLMNGDVEEEIEENEDGDFDETEGKFEKFENFTPSV